MTAIFRKILNIREGEGLRAALMFFYIFLVIASLLVIKPVRNSLFLTKFGAAHLPYAFILVAVFAAIVSTLYSKYANKLRLNVLIYYTILICIGCLFVFWLLIRLDYQGGWFIYAFYVWVAIFGVITTSQFWLLANYVFNAREAKRLFSLIGAGAITGGIFGGYLTSYLAPVIGTANLIFFCIGFLSICMLLLALVWRKGAWLSFQEKSRQPRRLAASGRKAARPLQLVLESRHLRYIAGLVGVSVIVANLVDYQYSAVASSVIENEDELTAFFGFWLSNLSVVSLSIQFFFTGRILRSLGVGPSLFFLPSGILIGAIILLIAPVLWAAVLIRVSDGAFKQSINKAGLELLALPIPKHIKNQTKTFIDVFVDSLGTGLGGILLIVSTVLCGFTTAQISIVIILLIGLWVYLILQVRTEYINSFRLALDKRTIEFGEPDINLNDASVFDGVRKVLEGRNDRQILYVLDLLESVRNEALLPHLQALLAHASGEIKARTLQLLRRNYDIDLAAEAIALITHEDQEVRIEAIRALCERAPDPLSRLATYLSHQDFHVQTAALMCAARISVDDRDFRARFDFKAQFDEILSKLRRLELVEQEKCFIKINAAVVIGIARDPELYPYLHILLNDKSPAVLRAAIRSAGQTGSREFVPSLLSHLKTKHARKAAREALATYGEAVIDMLVAHLHNLEQDHHIRLAVPKILGLIKSQKSVDALIANLHQDDLLLRFAIIKALNRLKRQMPLLKYDDRLIEKRILAEADHYYRLMSYLGPRDGRPQAGTVETDNGAVRRARHLLRRALEERLEDNLERIFRLLGLKYLPDDMYNAYKGIQSKQNELCANAIEFLDNVLDSHLKKLIIPIVESNSSYSLPESFTVALAGSPQADPHCLQAILHGGDSWLRACALYLIAQQQNEACLIEISRFLNDRDPIVRETAKLAMDRLNLAESG